ncbi:MAG: hypothetical protein LBP73_04580 [Clostridiales Family XIII bacterium]|jgi:hypothetical protein|nr:hypothetical protein [Clostridiales Family XIII bacterium]
MKKRILEARYSRGEVMIEGMLVMIITIFMLLFLIAMFSFLFFRWSLQTAANDIAARFAQSYSYLAYGGDVSLDSGKPASTNALDIDPYRYFFNKPPELEEAETYANERLKKSAAGFALGDPNVEIEPVSDFLGRRHIEVRISGRFRVLMQDVFAVEILNLERTFDYEVCGYADCVDLLDYLNTVAYAEWAADGAGLESGVMDLLNNVLELINEFL